MRHVESKFALGRHKMGCTTTEDGNRLEIPDLGSRGTIVSI